MAGNLESLRLKKKNEEFKILGDQIQMDDLLPIYSIYTPPYTLNQRNRGI